MFKKRERKAKGHARIIQMGGPYGLRDRVNEDEDHPFKMILESWGVDVGQYPDYETLSEEGWRRSKKKQKENYIKKKAIIIIKTYLMKN